MAKHFPDARPGDVFTARSLNDMRRMLGRHDRLAVGGAMSAVQSQSGTQLATAPFVPLLVELDEDVEAGDVKRQANVLRLEDTGEGPQWSDSGRDHGRIADAQGGIYLQGERHLVLAHPGSGARLVPPGVQWHLAVLNENLLWNDQAEATIYHIAAEAYEATSLTAEVHGWLLVENQHLPAGTRVAVAQHLQSRRWYVLNVVENPRRRFELTSNLAESGNADAMSIDSSGHEVSFVVWDALGIFSGSSGEKGLCEYWPDAQRWEIYQMQCGS